MSEIKEKKKFFASVHESAQSRDGFSTETLPLSIWQSFKLVFSTKFTFIIKYSLMYLLFLLPAIAWFIVVTYIGGAGKLVPFYVSGNTSVPYSGNIFGINLVTGVLETASLISYNNMMFFMSTMTLCVIVACVGIGGFFAVVRRMVWGEEVKIFRDFFTGVKNSWLAGLIGGIVCAGSFFLMSFSFYVFDAYQLSVVGKIFALIGSISLFALCCIFTAYMLSLSVTYKMQLSSLVMSSIKLTVGRLVPNLVMFVLFAWTGVVVWLLDAYMPTMAMYGYAIMLIIGFHFCAAVCTVNTHRQFDRIINGQGEAEEVTKSAPVYKKAESKVRETGVDGGEKKKPTHYTNPKKGKKKTEVEQVASLPLNIKGGENGLEEDLSVYIDIDEE